MSREDNGLFPLFGSFHGDLFYHESKASERRSSGQLHIRGPSTWYLQKGFTCFGICFRLEILILVWEYFKVRNKR